MSKQFDNANTGVLFQNNTKGNDKAPAWKGTINVEGKEFQISAWEKVSKKGQNFFSLQVSEPYQKEKTNKNIDETSDMPF